MTEKPDPFDVEGLERSLNDSATRVSAIWISFLVFGLYLVIAAGATTHRQLFLEDPVKLPVLNIELPLGRILLPCGNSICDFPYLGAAANTTTWEDSSGLQRRGRR